MGHLPETNASLDAAERELGLKLPTCVRWLLRDYGYWHATGIESLEDSVKNTIAGRKHVSLPQQYLVLYDHQDGGVVVVDSDDWRVGPPVFHLGWEDVEEGLHTEPEFASYLAYVKYVLESQRGFISESDIDYDPARYRSV
ncbi:MAG: SMI1/KNR4 family protein [Lacipirellulaceae bacterium]